MTIDASDITFTKLTLASARTFVAEIDGIPPQMIIRVRDIKCERIVGMGSQQ